MYVSDIQSFLSSIHIGGIDHGAQAICMRVKISRSPSIYKLLAQLIVLAPISEEDPGLQSSALVVACLISYDVPSTSHAKTFF